MYKLVFIAINIRSNFQLCQHHWYVYLTKAHFPLQYTAVLLIMSTAAGVWQGTRAVDNRFLQSITLCNRFLSSVQFSRSVVSDPLQPHVRLLAGTHIFSLILQGRNTMILKVTKYTEDSGMK